MAISDEELKTEKKYLEQTKKILEKMIDNANASVNYNKNDINELKRFMWDHLSDYTDEERAIAMFEVDNSVDNTNKQIDSIIKYNKALKSPYFGKIVFKDNEFCDEIPIYIGIGTVKDKLNFYVYDWRAPISSMFYNYELGKAKYEAPLGDVEGEVLSKMQFKIENGKIVRCFQSAINIDDEYLQEILAESSTDKMKNIVSTIQREQNEIIRNSSDKYLIVQGIAGSGKTSVALHRIAYLLYKDLKLTSNNILIFSPTDVFSDYISDVLPELGENNVLKSTFSEFALAFLKPYKNIESYCEFLERCYNGSAKNKDLIQYKMSDEYQKDLEKFYNEYENNICFKNGISHQNLSVSKTQLQYLLLEKYKKFPLKERLDSITEYVCSELFLPKKQYFNTVKKRIYEACNIDINYMNIYNRFLMSITTNNNNKVQKGKIEYEDITGLLYIYFKINGYPNYSHIRQVVIDEAQDYTPFQMQIIKNIFSKSSFTILGDINQTINPYYNYESLLNLNKFFPNAKYIELTKTYRSSEEIIDYSNLILGIENLCAVRENNNVPVILKDVKDENLLTVLNNDLSSMYNDGLKKIAIITKDAKQAINLYDMCLKSNKLDVQLITSDDNCVKKSTIIIPSYLSKGLEFDGVISYSNSENNYTEQERNLYYVVCTRAQHKLNVYNEPQKILKRSIINN